MLLKCKRGVLHKRLVKYSEIAFRMRFTLTGDLVNSGIFFKSAAKGK